MKGFGYCVWWKIKNHPINLIVQHLSKTFNTPAFEPHISIRTKLPYIPVEFVYPEFKDVITHQYKNMHTSSTYIYSWDAQFHAIEIPVAGPHLTYKSHVSVAYRLHQPFTEEELQLAERTVSEYHFTNILYNNLDVGVYDASSIHPEEWFRISKVYSAL